jgi:hypothetical protein
MTTLKLELLHDTFAICRLASTAAVPEWATGEFVSITRTPAELSIVCSQDAVPKNAKCEFDWRCLQVIGPLDFSLVGVIASLTDTLAAANISLFVISTFDTDYLLVKRADVRAAVESLNAVGHAVSHQTGYDR